MSTTNDDRRVLGELPTPEQALTALLQKETGRASEFRIEEWPARGSRAFTLPLYAEHGPFSRPLVGYEIVELRRAVGCGLRFSVAWSETAKRAFWSRDF